MSEYEIYIRALIIFTLFLFIGGVVYFARNSIGSESTRKYLYYSNELVEGFHRERIKVEKTLRRLKRKNYIHYQTFIYAVIHEFEGYNLCEILIEICLRMVREDMAIKKIKKDAYNSIPPLPLLPSAKGIVPLLVWSLNVAREIDMFNKQARRIRKPSLNRGEKKERENKANNRQ